MKKKGRKKRFTLVERSWILYDWANSVWATNIAAAIFPIYFALKASDTGNALFGYMVSTANLIVAVLAPYLGSIGDLRGMKKKMWVMFMLIGVVFTALMGLVSTWQMMLVGFVISRIGFSGSSLFYDSFLTDVTTPERMDKVSSWGFAMGYIGGSTIPFVLSILVMILMDMSDLSYRIAILIVPLWWALFSIPFYRHVEQVHFIEATEKPGRQAFKNMLATFRDIMKDKAILFFILAYFFYIDGVDTIISMATNYGSTLGLGSIGMILALLVTQLVAVPCSILFGNLSKKVGTLRLIAIAVGIYAFITIVGFFMGFLVDFHGMLGLALERAKSLGTILFWILATLVGTVQGGIQALSRSFYGKLIPPERSNEYFGFLDIFGKFSCIIGPALYALAYGVTGKACFGVLSLILLFLCGGLMLLLGRPHFRNVQKAK
ncbi:MAG: MFS transporter [Clostridiales bacterium]|nr:MFS transporter [Bacillota bacterium]NLL55205.1 MFS transporter [Clostridiales bacterium]